MYKGVVLLLDFNRETMQEYPQGQGASGYHPQFGFQNSTSWQACDHYETTPSSSNSNFREEVETSNDFSRYGCMSPYMGYYGNEDMLYEGFDLPNSVQNPKPFKNDLDEWM